MNTYSLLSHSERAPSLGSLTRLMTTCFARYPGVLTVTEPFVRWFISRPGFDPSLSQAAWAGDDLASSLFVTRARLTIHGESCPFALIDTVMTHPKHRRNGLARQLLERTIAANHEHGVSILALYTAPGSPGAALYASLGFQPVHQLLYWQRPPQARPPSHELQSWTLVGDNHWLEVARLIESRSSIVDGVPLHDEHLWRWRKVDRPLGLAAEVWAFEEQSGITQTITATRASLTTLGDHVLIADIVAYDADSFSALCAHLGRRLPLLTIADPKDDHLIGMLKAGSFSPTQEEVVMLLPLSSPMAANVLTNGRRPWFPLTESIIGV